MSTFAELPQSDDDGGAAATGLTRASTMGQPPPSPLARSAPRTPPGDETREVFLSSNLTLKEVDSARQTFTVSGFINALWQCPDLEHEQLHQDYYANEYTGLTIKKGLEVAGPEAKKDAKDKYLTVLDRPYVQKEIGWARKYDKKIIVVYEKEPERSGFFDYGRAAAKYAGTDMEFILGIDAIPYRREAYEAEAMMKNIFAKTTLGADGMDATRLDDSPSAPQLTPRTESAAARAAGFRNQPGAWKFFLSHHQRYGGDQTQNLHNSFKAKGAPAWYDNAMLDKSEAAMEEGVKNSEYFVLVLTGAPERMSEP